MKVGQVVEEIEICKALSHKVYDYNYTLTTEDRNYIGLMLSKHIKRLKDVEVKSDND